LECGEPGAAHEAHERAERRCRREADEIKAGHGGLEAAFESRPVAIGASNPRAKLGIQAPKTIYVDSVARCRHYMVERRAVGCAGRCCKRESHTICIARCEFEAVVQMDRHVALHAISEPPGARWAKHRCYEAESQPRGQVPEGTRNGAECDVRPSRSEGRLGLERSAQALTIYIGRTTCESNARAANENVNSCTGLVQECCRLQCRLTGPKDSNAPAGKTGHVRVL
jgi:hypothetical protein